MKKIKEYKKDKMLYLVMRLQTDMEIEYPTGVKSIFQLSGMKGYAPVYKTIKEAIEASCDGKYKIKLMEVTE